MKYDKAFPPENIDEQVEQAIVSSPDESLSSESKMLQHLSDLYLADKHSVERVEQRLAQHLTRNRTTERSALTLLKTPPTVPKEEKSPMASEIHTTKSRASTRFLLVAATLTVSLLVGSLLLVLNIAYHNHTAGQTTLAATPGIYFSRQGEVYRLDIQTRKVIWQTSITDRLPRTPPTVVFNNSLILTLPFVSIPVVIDNQVYLISDKTIIALDAQTGEIHWFHTFPRAVSGPIGENHHVYVYEFPGFPNSTLYTINPSNGRITATYTLSGQVHWNNPGVVNGVLYYQTDSSIYAVQLSNRKLLWNMPLSRELIVPRISVQGGLVIINSQQTVGGGAPNKELVEALNASNGDKLWQLPDMGTLLRDITVTNERIYAASTDKRLFAFDAHTRKLLWQKPYDTFKISVFSDTLYLDYNSPTSKQNAFAAVDAASGQMLWQKENSSNGGGGGAQIVGVSTGVVYGVGWTKDGKKGTLYAMNARAGSLLWTMPTNAEPLQWPGLTVVG
ncbi:MAG TPA: PQQ-binding-like beta-propeller repeat protein [Ktedonobacteraceae bacterium]|nr:PQQ-binding-like beta-propeller repeat protein [Ktedonobacteraceae bacterium]